MAVLGFGLLGIASLGFLVVWVYYRDLQDEKGQQDDRPCPGAHRPERLGYGACRVAITSSGSFIRLERGTIAADSGFFTGNL